VQEAAKYQRERYKLLQERSVYSRNYLDFGDIVEKDPLVYDAPEGSDVLPEQIDKGTYLKVRSSGKRFLERFIRMNYTKKQDQKEDEVAEFVEESKSDSISKTIKELIPINWRGKQIRTRKVEFKNLFSNEKEEKKQVA